MAHSIAETVRSFLCLHPHIRECLREDLINYSALARSICSENGNNNFEGTVAACRRAAEKLQKVNGVANPAQTVLAHSHVSLVNEMSVAVIERPLDSKRLAELEIFIRNLHGECNRIEGRDLVTVVHSSRFSNKIREAFSPKIRRITNNLSQITIIFDEHFESTAGVVATIYNRFAADGVNIREELSCGANLLLIVAEEDSATAVKLLTSLQSKVK